MIGLPNYSITNYNRSNIYFEYEVKWIMIGGKLTCDYILTRLLLIICCPNTSVFYLEIENGDFPGLPRPFFQQSTQLKLRCQQ